MQVVILISGVLQTGCLFAQTPAVGQHLHQKLLNAQWQYQKSLATGDSLAVAEACYILGKRYVGLGDYRVAQQWFVRSLRIREPGGPSEEVSKTYLRMAENTVRQRQYEPAMRYARRAYENARQVQSKHGMMSADIVLAGVHGLGSPLDGKKSHSAPDNRLDSVLYHLRRAEQLALLLNNKADISNVYACMGNALAPSNAARAVSYLHKAYAINRQDRSQLYSLINLSQQLADCYLRLGQPLTAKKWLDRAVYSRDTANFGDYEQISHLEATYTALYKQTGDWKRAFEHQDNYYKLQLKTSNADRDGTVARLELGYESQKKEARLRAQQQELTLRQANLKVQQRLTLVTAVLLLLAVSGCVVFYWSFTKYKRMSSYNAKLVREQNHRVKNNLQSITSLLGLQFNRLADSDARDAVGESLLRVEAMALVHQRLYDGDRLAEVNLREYIPELVNGVLRSFNFNHIQPVFKLQPMWLDADLAINIGLLLNELVTNSCKYAFGSTPAPALEIGFREKDGRMYFWFSDNGPGFTSSVKKNTFGLKLIDMITRKLGGEHTFQAEKGCRFTLQFEKQSTVAAYSV